MDQAPVNLKLNVNQRNQRRLHSLIDELFCDYSKVLVVRLDFYLQKYYADINTYEYMNEAFYRFRNYQRFNQLFEYYITYAAKLEYGTDRLWHYHVVLFFDGQKLRSDYLLAQDIGEYWVDTITRGLGAYYSANMNAKRYQTFALGMISYNELGRIKNLKSVLNYLVKEGIGEPVRRDAVGKAYRSYRQGVYKPRNSRSGRPRQY